MSSYHLAPDLVGSYLDAMSRYHVTYLYGYTSSLYALAQAVIESGRQDIGMAVSITSAEPIYDYQRATIAQAFNRPVRETYGMSEIVTAAASVLPDGCTCSLKLGGWKIVACCLLVPQVILSVRA